MHLIRLRMIDAVTLCGIWPTLVTPLFHVSQRLPQSRTKLKRFIRKTLPLIWMSECFAIYFLLHLSECFWTNRNSAFCRLNNDKVVWSLLFRLSKFSCWFIAFWHKVLVLQRSLWIVLKTSIFSDIDAFMIGVQKRSVQLALCCRNRFPWVYRIYFQWPIFYLIHHIVHHLLISSS